MWAEIYDRIAALIGTHRTTIVFVNTRRLVERVAHQLAKRLGEDRVAAHHGSLSPRVRLEAERRLKAGEAPVVVATASLELGIDVGTVDLAATVPTPGPYRRGSSFPSRGTSWCSAPPPSGLSGPASWTA
jgi:Lhr-like helicase